MRMRVEGVKNAYLRRRHLRSSFQSRSRLRSLRLMLSKSRSRRSRRLRRNLLLNPSSRRSGPRPSQRPSRASWQLTNFAHFLSMRETLRPRPWPRVSDEAKVINRPTTKIPNRFLDVKSFIKVPPKMYRPMRGGAAIELTWHQFQCRFDDLF